MKSLTEREIIRILTTRFDRTANIPLGFNDDVSAFPISTKAWIIMKTDMLVGSTDVPPGMTPREAARKAVVASVSDFAAKGVQPQALMVSLGIPAPARTKEIREITRGLNQAAREYSCKIIGGDTNQAQDFVIDIVAVGIANPERLIRRDGAQPGDIVAVTGPFGRSAAGLKVLTSKRMKRYGEYRSLVSAVLRPKARLSTGIELARAGGVTSSIDSSDGLAMSLHQLAEASNTGISLEGIPIDPAVQRFARRFKFSAFDLAMYGGEEYELVVTIEPKRFLALRKQIRSLKAIGKVEAANHGLTANFREQHVRIEKRGWEHFM